MSTFFPRCFLVHSFAGTGMCSLVAGVIMYLLFLGVYISLHHLESYIVFLNLLGSPQMMVTKQS